MQCSIPKKNIGNSDVFLRRAGYGLHQSRGEKSFVKRLDAGNFPRLHLYVAEAGENITLNLHLDQKAPLYEGMTAHAGEYDGAVVEGEINRLKKIARV
jgi:hypothetical protein